MSTLHFDTLKTSSLLSIPQFFPPPSLSHRLSSYNSTSYIPRTRLTPHPPNLQGYELQMGTNCLGPFLLTRLLLPLLTKTAAISAPNSVRVTWAASVALDGAPEHGIEWNDKKKAPATHKSQSVNYAQSKVGNLFLAAEFARRHGRETGVVSAAYNPGNLRTELMRHANPIAAFVFVSVPFFSSSLEPYLPSFFC